MKAALRDKYLSVKVKVGEALLHSNIRVPRGVKTAYQILQLSKFTADSGLRACPAFSHRFQLYEFLHDKYVKDKSVDYLEFGVWKGESIQKWADLNKNPQSRFFGFDSFEGLPEEWGGLAAGHFTTQGKIPVSPDARLQFIKGWFQDTLGGFLQQFQLRSQLVVYCDADLYSSTLYILAMLNGFFSKGTIIIFDEFNSADHEFRAYMDYVSAFRRTLLPIASANDYAAVAFIMS